MRWRDPDVLRELYVEECLSCREVGDRLDCSAKTVSDWLGRHGIEARDISEANSLAGLDEPVPFETYERGYERWYHNHRGERVCVRVHRLVAVAEHGLDAVVGKDIHHKNGVPWDNRPENIEVIDHAEHSRLHAFEKRLGGGEA